MVYLFGSQIILSKIYVVLFLQEYKSLIDLFKQQNQQYMLATNIDSMQVSLILALHEAKLYSFSLVYTHKSLQQCSL